MTAAVLRRRPSHSLLAAILLVAFTASWGSTFFMIRDVVQVIPAADFLAVRFAIASALLTVLFWRPLRALTSREWRIGIGLGVLYGAAQILQTQGLAHTAASRSGFITGMYVVLTPLFAAVLLRARLPVTTWLAVLLAITGLGVLSLGPGAGDGIGVGEVLTLIAAGFYALHIVGLGRVARTDLAAGLSVVQIYTITVITTIAALPGGITVPQSGSHWAAVLYMAIVAGAGAMWAQSWAQSHLTATRAAIIMTMEPVFAAGFAVLFGGESPTWRMLLGGALVLAAMYVVELRPGRREPDVPVESLHHDPAA